MPINTVSSAPIVPHRLRIVSLAFSLFLFCAPLSASENWSSLPINEHLMGATNVHAIAGNGGLSAGLSAFGELSVLTWPSPSYTDQLAYITSNHPDARSWPRFGAKEGMGAFFGLRYRVGEEERFTWLRGEGWISSLSYASEFAPVVVTTLTNDNLGITVHVTDLVLSDTDVLARHVHVTQKDGAQADPLSLIAYANLSPTLARVPKLPIADWALDPRNDFAAIYDAARDILFHFRPGDTGQVASLIDLVIPPAIDYGPIGTLLQEESIPADAVAKLAADLETQYAPGVYIAMSGAAKVSDRSVQIGFDTTELCAAIDELGENILLLPERFPEADPMDLSALDMLRCVKPALEAVRESEGWVYEAEDAYSDAPDGLGGSHVAAGQVNSAMELTLVSSPEGKQATLYLGFADTASEVAALLSHARASDFQDHLDSTLSDWMARIEPLRLPDTDDADILAFCRRTLVNLLVGTDRNTGAIVASLSRQPAYGEDWPRDGAFFNAALDAAGLHDLVTRRMLNYAAWQRKSPAEPEALIDAPPPLDPDDPESETYPAGAWEMNYYADGMIGGFIRYEIDNTAFLLWNYGYHAGYIEGDDARTAYLKDVWPTVKLGADLLTRWRDPETGLAAPANENDNPAYTSTLFGAGPIFAGLVNAAKIARALEHDAEADAYEARAEELREAILTHLVDSESGLLLERRNLSGHPGSNLHAASSTAIWPGRLFDFKEAKSKEQMRINLDDVLAVLRGETDGGSYLNKVTLAAALALGDSEDRETLAEALRIQTHDLPTPQTRHYGEVFLYSNGVYEQQVANPHLWAATLTYLTAMAYYNPELFDRHLCVLPETRLDTPYECSLPTTDGDTDDAFNGDTEPDESEPAGSPSDSEGSGGCWLANDSENGWAMLLLFLLAALHLSRKKERSGFKPRLFR